MHHEGVALCLRCRLHALSRRKHLYGYSINDASSFPSSEKGASLLVAIVTIPWLVGNLIIEWMVEPIALRLLILVLLIITLYGERHFIIANSISTILFLPAFLMVTRRSIIPRGWYVSPEKPISRALHLLNLDRMLTLRLLKQCSYMISDELPSEFPGPTYLSFYAWSWSFETRQKAQRQNTQDGGRNVRKGQGFHWGEVAAGSVEMVRPSQGDKGYIRPAWARGPEKAKNRGGRREIRRNMRIYTPYARKYAFTLLIKTSKEILAMESVS
nr:hypothetical protein [Tanacetum cinerariifolium]